MTHPWEANCQILYDARATELSDGASVEVWEPTFSQIAGDITPLDVNRMTVDLDGMGGEPCFVLPGGSSQADYRSTVYGANGIDWAFAIRMQLDTYQTFAYGLFGYTAAGVQFDFIRWHNDGSVRFFAGALVGGTIPIGAPTVLAVRMNQTAGTGAAWIDGVKVGEVSYSGDAKDLARIWLHDSSFQRFQCITQVGGVLLSDNDMATTLTDYVETFDSTYTGGVGRTMRYDAMAVGSHLWVTEAPHVATLVADFTGIVPSALEGTCFTFEVVDDTQTSLQHYVWFTWNGSGADPAPGGTGVQVDLVTGDTIEDAVSAMQTAVHALTYAAAAAEGATLRILGVVEGKTGAPPEDVSTGADVAEVLAGGTADDFLVEVETTVGAAPSITYTTDGRPRLIRSAFIDHGVSQQVAVSVAAGLSGAAIPAGALQREDRVYANP